MASQDDDGLDYCGPTDHVPALSATDADVAIGLIERLRTEGVIPKTVHVGNVRIDIQSVDWSKARSERQATPLRPGTAEWYRAQVVEDGAKKAAKIAQETDK